MSDSEVRRKRERFETRLGDLRGRRIKEVTYYDIHGSPPQPRPEDWDHGDWHHAVMGVELITDAGRVSVTWGDTFSPYGIEIVDWRIYRGPGGPVGWKVSNHPLWQARLGRPIKKASTLWETWSDESDAISVPLALRLDIEAHPVWLVAAQPIWPKNDPIDLASDEVMVVLSAERMRAIGISDGDFLQPNAS